MRCRSYGARDRRFGGVARVTSLHERSGSHIGREKPAGPSNLRLRIISALVLYPACAACHMDGWPRLQVFVAIVALAMIHEWLSITAARDWSRTHWLTGGLLAALMVMLVAGISPGVLLGLMIVPPPPPPPSQSPAPSSRRGFPVVTIGRPPGPANMQASPASRSPFLLPRRRRQAGLWGRSCFFSSGRFRLGHRTSPPILSGPRDPPARSLAPRISPGKGRGSGAIGGRRIGRPVGRGDGGGILCGCTHGNS